MGFPWFCNGFWIGLVGLRESTQDLYIQITDYRIQNADREIINRFSFGLILIGIEVVACCLFIQLLLTSIFLAACTPNSINMN